MHKDIEKIFVTKQEIEDIVKKIAEKIDKDYQGKDLILIGVLKGSVCFVSDIMKAVNIDCKIDFIEVSSYGSGTVSTGRVNVKKDVSQSLAGKNVLIVEDIIDSGNTLNFLVKYFTAKDAKSVKIATLLDKPDRRQVDIPVDYVGKIIADEFVVGYGLDYGEKYRNLPYIGILKPQVYL